MRTLSVVVLVTGLLLGLCYFSEIRRSESLREGDGSMVGWGAGRTLLPEFAVAIAGVFFACIEVLALYRLCAVSGRIIWVAVGVASAVAVAIAVLMAKAEFNGLPATAWTLLAIGTVFFAGGGELGRTIARFLWH